MYKIIRFQLLGLIVAGLVFIPLIAFSQTEIEKCIFDYVFLLDTSGSMVGEPEGSGNPVIFPEVKEKIGEFLEDIEPGTNIFIYPFDEGIHDAKRFEIREKNDIQKVQIYIDNLEAKGLNTWIYRSLKDAIDRITNFQTEDHVVITYLYTDGLDTDRTKRYSMKDIMKYFDLKKGEQDWLYYCTLGVELPPEEKIILEESDNVILMEERDGVSPIFLIKPKFPVLNYGNLMKTGESVRVERFTIHNRERLPANLEISVEPSFPLLEKMGVDIEIIPNQFSPREKVELKFSLPLPNRNTLDEEKNYGEYEGEFILRTNKPGEVFVIPNKVKVKFTYEPEQIVTIFLADDEKPPLDFGELDVFKEKRLVTERKRIILDYNAQAVKKGGILKIYAEPSDKNPSRLTYEKNLIINDERSEYVKVLPPTKELVLKVVADKDLKPGRYKGTLSFESEDLTIAGEGLESKKDEPAVRFVTWSFTIPRPPWSLWKKILFGIIALIVLFVVGTAIYCAVTGNPIPKPHGKVRIPKGTSLEVRDPKEHRGEQIDLSGKREVKMGQDGEYFQDTNVSFVIKAVREGRKDFMTLSVGSGEIYLKKIGEREETAIFEERIFDGDTIRFGDYKIRMSSFSLMRE